MNNDDKNIVQGLKSSNKWRYALYDLLVIALCVQSYTWKNLPGLLFGMLSLFAGILSLCLPETKKVPLTQTMDEGEKFAANMVITDYWSVAALLSRILTVLG